ncbi:MAG: hypothetical protein ACOYLG_08435, partial [Chitinophagaceae bacterium]
SLSVHSLCFPSPWFVSSQTISSTPLSFCSLALLSNPMVCVFTNHPFCTVLFLFSRSAFHPHGLCLHKPWSRKQTKNKDLTRFSLLNICTCDDVQPRWQPGTMCGVQRELR